MFSTNVCVANEHLLPCTPAELCVTTAQSVVVSDVSAPEQQPARVAEVGAETADSRRTQAYTVIAPVNNKRREFYSH